MHALLIDLGHSWLSGMFHDLRRYAIFAVAVWLSLWVAFARVLRQRKIRDDRPPMRQLGLEFLYSVRSIAMFSSVGIVIDLLTRFGFYPMEKAAESWGPAWFAISLVLMILGQDAWIYWTHRWMHHPRAFRTFHRRHHKSHNPSPFTAYSFDIPEALVNVAFVLVWPLIVPTPWPVTGFFVLHQIFRNTLLHSGYELMPARADGRPWLDWLTTTTHHDMHHAQAGWNYGAWFTWWDRRMGTEHPDYYARYAATARRPFLTRDGVRPAPTEA
jgi:sterol desaturase/sphingolipid hydroxylase (fatty acid hydroxylase superfamily)